MIATDRDALLCDMAENYHIYDFRALPVLTLAALACGLGEDSRIRRLMSGTGIDRHTLLLATIADRLGWLVWANSEDGRENRNKPESIVNMLLGGEDTNKAARTFASPEEFERERKRIIEGK